MTEKSLDIITRITVEIHKGDTTKEKLGSGVLYSHSLLTDLVYVLTAKHCLSGLAENDKVSLRVFNSESCKYDYITPAKQNILLHPVDDAGIIIVNRRELTAIIPNIPSIFVVDGNVGFDEAITKGFPIAYLDQTSEMGESSLATLKMSYLQEIPKTHSFQLSTLDDYSEDTIKGMSGAGIFIEACEELYINGIFTRFTDQERGKVIFSQRLTSFNELLELKYKTKMPLSFLGHHGLGHKTFENNVHASVANLGPRYCQKVKVKTGTAKYFDCIAKTPDYYKRLTVSIDSWLTEKSYKTRMDSSRIGYLESELKTIRNDFVRALLGLDKSVLGNIDLFDLIRRVVEFQTEVNNVRHKLFSDFSSFVKNEDHTKELENDDARLLEISEDIYTFIDNIEDLKIELANNPYLIIKGEAGCGKSHLLGDMASHRIGEGLPTLLFLGTDFTDGAYESTITSKIGFAGTFPEFLSSLNQIGIQVGSRALIMIDALNEGNLADLWKERLPGLIKSLVEYPAIGLVVSVRDTYFDDVIPDDVEKNCNATIIEHKGFKGLEYDAVRQFCVAYKLNLPNVPILTPEFCNPLFLKIICDTLEAAGEKNFPHGFNGISTLFNQYFKNLDKKLANKKPEYKHRNVVSSSIKLLAHPIFESKYNLLKTTEADSILQAHFPYCPTLLADLIDNNILLKTKSQLKEDSDDYVVFCYQRISDYIIANELVGQYHDWESFVDNIHSDKALNAVIVDPYWLYKGILEALAILIPEVFNHEITDLIKSLPKKGLKRNLNWCLESISEAQINSLNWRSLESINKTAIRKFLQSKMSRVRPEDWYYKLAELSTIPNHPFNADYFHALLMRMTMPVRDGHFQFFFNGCAGHDDDKCANPMRRLIDWAWSLDVSLNADSESVRLASIMLCWLLSSTYIKHRDEATKALVNLLTEKVDVLISVMRSFEKVDDMYIYERLFAVAYGVALRTSTRNGLANLAKYVYNTIFKHGNPPKNILLRDHARNLIEYAKYKVGVTSINMKKVRPPYLSDIPEWPTEDQVKHLHIDYEAPDFKKRHGYEQNMIWESIKGGLADFWNKLASPVLEDFYPISISEEKVYKKAERLFKGDMKKVAKLYSEYKARTALDTQTGTNKTTIQSTLLEMLNQHIEKMMTEEQLTATKEIMIPFYIKELPLRKHHYNRFPTAGIRNWLVKRSYELGFDANLHGQYDCFAKDWTFRHSQDRIDRIGKKYQWIAFHEILGILSDNYKFEDDYANNGSREYELFQGTWQSFLRDINPSMIARDKNMVSEPTINSLEDEERIWYRDEKYDNWEYAGTDESWASLIDDLPDPGSMIQKIDDNGIEWLTLNNSVNWDEPKSIGKEKYQHKFKRHDVAMYVDAILVKQQDIEQAILDLSNKNLWGVLDIPSDDWQYLINREKYWSPAYQDVYKSRNEWVDSIDGLSIPFIYSSEKACGHIEGDKSGTISSYSIPCKRLFEGLGMEYGSHDGQYINKDGNLVAITYGYDQILVKKEPLIKFLEDSDLSILWIVRGEKRVYVGGGMGCLSEYNPCGIYYLDNSKSPEGFLKMHKRV